MSPAFKIIITVIITAAVIGGGGWYYMDRVATRDKNDLRAEIAVLQQEVKDLKAESTTPSASSGTTTAPTTTTDETANWKTYTNTTYDYSIKYPVDWKVLESVANNITANASTTVLSVWDPTTKIVSPTVEKSAASSVALAISQAKSDLDAPVEKKVTIGAISATKISGKISSGNRGEGESRERYIVDNDGTILLLEVDSGNSALDVVNKILSTFQFTK